MMVTCAAACLMLCCFLQLKKKTGDSALGKCTDLYLTINA